jgi:hypothetical protein
MLKIIVDNKELFIRKETSIQLEVSNSIFSTEKTDGEVIFTFDVPAKQNDLIFNHARFVFVKRMKKYSCRIEVGGYLIGQGDLYVQKSNSKNYSIGVVVNPFPDNFIDKKLSENNYGDDIIISTDITNHNQNWLNFLNDSLKEDSNIKFPLFYNDEIYGENNSDFSYFNLETDNGTLLNNNAVLTNIKGDPDKNFVNRVFFDSNKNIIEEIPYNRGIRIFNRYGSSQLNSFTFCPAIKIVFILKKIFENAGYKITGNFINNKFINYLYNQSLRTLDGGETQFEINTTVKEIKIDNQYLPTFSNETSTNYEINNLQMNFKINDIEYNTFRKSQYQNSIKGNIRIKTFIPSSVIYDDPSGDIFYRLALVIIPKDMPLPDYWEPVANSYSGWSNVDGQGGRYIQQITFPNGYESKKFPTEWYGGYIKVWGKSGDIDGTDINFIGSGFYELTSNFLIKQNVDSPSDLESIKYKIILAKIKVRKIELSGVYTYKIWEWTKFVPSTEYEPQFFIHNIYTKKFNLCDYMPSLSNEEFITEICNVFGVARFIDSTKKEIELSFIKDILKSQKYLDLSKYCLTNETTIEDSVENNFLVSLSAPLVDNYPTEWLDDVDELNDLPDAKLNLGKYCYVKERNAIYNSQQVGSDEFNFIYKWIVYSGNIKNKIVGSNNKKEINSKIKIPYLQQFHNEDNGLYPVINVQGYSPLLNKKSSNTNFDSYLYVYQGNQKFFYTKSGSYVYRELFSPISSINNKNYGQLDLTVNTTNSIGNVLISPWLELLSNYEVITYKFRFPLSKFLEVIALLKPQENNPDRQIRFAFVNGTKLLPIKMIFQFRAGSENILAEIEFAKEKVKI